MGGSTHRRPTNPFPVVLSGPSGVGKTTLVEGLLAADPLLVQSVSSTTRPPRPGEVDGESYFFVSEKEFESLKRGKLIEWAVVHGHSYGTPRDFVDSQLAAGRDVVLNIDVQGGASVKKAFPNAVLIFILPPTLAVLEERIRGRGTDETEVIEERLENARGEIRKIVDYEYVVINDDLVKTVETLRRIIEGERCRRARFPRDFVQRFIDGE
jgi:guanylate kinase